MPSKMIVLGVDPGLRSTGYGVIEIVFEPNYQVKLLETGTINPKQKDSLENRINKVYQHLSDIVKQYTPQIMVLEKLYAHYRHPLTACLLGHVRGVICLVCAHHGIGLEEHSVKRIRKSLTGNGNATKEQTQMTVERILKIPEGKLSLDASDALALALGYGYMNRF
ncbi:MAG: crossover junction endodeoxyribonuclease RuvC [Candidatus Omnitrophota bacterium]